MLYKELKFKLNWYICANTSEVEKNFAVIINKECQYKEFSYTKEMNLSKQCKPRLDW